MRSLFYIALKQYCRSALWFYYRKWQVQNVEPVPSGPLIFVANHQNAFLDAVLVSCSTSRNPWFLTRANVFEKPWARVLLSWMKMTPVYRFRDGFGTLRKNEMAIKTCVNLLSQGESILIFAEGNHDERWSLRPFQKGFARIAIAAAEKNIHVTIVPIGLQYDSPAASRVLVSFGKPISVKELIAAQSDGKAQIDLLIAKTSDSIKSLIVHIARTDYENRKAQFLQNRILKSDLKAQLEADQKTVSEFNPEVVSHQYLSKKTLIYSWLNPFFIYSYLNHFLPIIIINRIIKIKVKDMQFIDSLKFSLGMFLIPVFYLIQTEIVYLVSKSLLGSIIYFVSLPISFAFLKKNRNSFSHEKICLQKKLAL
ncbi:MAG: 1-acyl-sn-glycerol-3-phosphate acyltransferase [Cyclobacteriaceae bacterium]